MAPCWEERAAFCMVCGGDLIEREVFDARRLACSRCDYVLFRSPAGAAATVVARGREVLLVERAIEPYRGAWGFPAGFQEYHESPAEAAIRETREESGLEVELVGILDVAYTRDDPRKRSNVVVYLARPVAGELRAADDAADVAYFSLDALPSRIAFENNRRILQRLRREHPSGDIL